MLSRSLFLSVNVHQNLRTFTRSVSQYDLDKDIPLIKKQDRHFYNMFTAKSYRALQAVFDNHVQRGAHISPTMKDYYAYSLVHLGEEKKLIEMEKNKKIDQYALIYGFARNGKVNEAKEIFEKLEYKGRRAYASIIGGYVKLGQFDQVDLILNEMKANQKPITPEIITEIISAFARLRDRGNVSKYFSLCEEQNILPTAGMYVGVINELGKQKDFEGIKKMIDHILSNGIEFTVPLYNSLIYAFMMGNKIPDAMNYFNELTSHLYLKPNTATFAAIIKGYCATKHYAKAIESLQRMISRDVERNPKIYASMIHMMNRDNQFDLAKQVLNMMEKEQGFYPKQYLILETIKGIEAKGDTCFDLKKYLQKTVQNEQASKLKRTS